ncbi:polysaccharide deacetylase family protein [Arthrobacter sp. U41]|uniref:polysaccharide deacetylase family protein n=1 Tax=Arthrobacter sp. U41 TaxID=1849032 RepID=UPI00085950FC|nr:polysaccharide deacetylase family protein [Arthrobacter sp. U41]AOT03208.1 polysaccharide deacetylase [Arthrobacter sp. U41]
MWAIFTGDRRRWLAAAAAVLLLAAGVVLAVVLTAVPPSSAPTPSPSPSSPSLPASASPSSSPSESPAPASPSDTPVPTETVPAGPAPVPPVPPPAPPAPAPAPPAPAPAPPAPAPPAPFPAAPFPAALAGRDLEVIPGAGAVVALTFDAGANSAGLPSILQTLAGTGVRGTFFLTGNWAAANPAGVASIVAAGHRVGNHSMTHPGFTGLSDAAIGRQLSAAEQAIRAGGGEPRPLFRFPFGERDARTIATVNAYGYLPVRWTVDTLGWKGSSGGITAQIVADRVLARLQPGEIVLMHIGSNPDDGTTLDADALPGMIERIRQAGYGFTTLDALLG